MAEPITLRTTKIGNGFVKEDVLAYIGELDSKIEGLEKELKKAKGAKGAAIPAQRQELMECNMAEPCVLRSTKVGNGFVKEDVLAYLDKLNSKIEGLEQENSILKQRISEYENKISAITSFISGQIK